MIALHHEPPELIICASFVPEGQRENPLSDLVLKNLPLFLEVQLIITTTQRPQLRSKTLAKHCVAEPLENSHLVKAPLKVFLVHLLQQGSSLCPGQAHLGIVLGISILTCAENKSQDSSLKHRDRPGVFVVARTLDDTQHTTGKN